MLGLTFLQEGGDVQSRSLEDFIAACQRTERLSGLWEVALEFFHSRGIAMVSYHSDDAQTPGSKPLGLVSDGFPEDWVCRYIDGKLSLIDPIPGIASRMVRPFLWSEAGQIAKLTEEQQRYMQELTESELGDGLAVQVFGPNMRNAYVGLGFGHAAPEMTPQEIHELQAAAQIAHIRYCEITEQRRQRFELSPRELEVLGWIAKGKSNSVIAEILGISPHSVDTTIRRMFDKLDVNDRTSAAIRGLGAGLLHPRRDELG